MTLRRPSHGRSVVLWAGLIAAMIVPLAAAATSPLLAWREPIYIAAGLAGVIALALMLVQPLLVSGSLPGVPLPRARRLHRWIGTGLVIAVIIHVVALWITSPPDVIDALLFSSPTPFAIWGVMAMWAVFAAAALAVLRKRLRLGMRIWRIGHTALVSITVVGSVVHAMLIDGTMETLSKTVLCALVLVSTIKIVKDLSIWLRSGRSKLM